MAVQHEAEISERIIENTKMNAEIESPAKKCQ